jgi:hypothetical protein
MASASSVRSGRDRPRRSTISSTVSTQPIDRDISSSAIQCWSAPRMLAVQSEANTTW